MVSIPTRYNIQRLKEKEKSTEMMTAFGVSKSFISSKIATVGLINQYPDMKSFSMYFYFLKKHMEIVKKIVKGILADLNKQQKFR